jgi:hypothetical protein
VFTGEAKSTLTRLQGAQDQLLQKETRGKGEGVEQNAQAKRQMGQGAL